MTDEEYKIFGLKIDICLKIAMGRGPDMRRIKAAYKYLRQNYKNILTYI